MSARHVLEEAKAIALERLTDDFLRQPYSEYLCGRHGIPVERLVFDVAEARQRVRDAVLLSPACASFDMFDNYEHRSRVFCEAVQALALEEGMLL